MSIGVIIGLLTALFFGIGTFLAKIVCEKDPIFQWIVVNIVGIILCIAILAKYHQKLQVFEWKILLYAVSSAIMIVLGSLLLYYGLYKGKASIVVPLSSIGPAITVILAVIFLKEQLTTNQIMGIFLILLGIILISINQG
nr:EamA family transporter [Methanotorris igneus]